MSDPLPTRSEVRDAFKALLAAEMVGANLVQGIYSFLPDTFGTLSPVMVIDETGTERVPLPHAGSYPNYLIRLWVFVLYAEVTEEGQVTLDPTTLLPTFDDEASERKLDLLEVAVRRLIDSAQPGAYWDSIEYAGPSSVGVTPVGDQSYRSEVIPLRFKMM